MSALKGKADITSAYPQCALITQRTLARELFEVARGGKTDELGSHYANVNGLMMGSTQVEPSKIHKLCDRYRRFVVRRSYSCLPGQLPAFLNRRIAPLVDVGGQIDQMD